MQTIYRDDTVHGVEYVLKSEALAEIDAAMKRDCRLCANFTVQTGGCISAVQCVDGNRFWATYPRQYWSSATKAAPQAAGS